MIKKTPSGKSYVVNKNGELKEVVSMPINKDEKLIDIVNKIDEKYIRETNELRAINKK